MSPRFAIATGPLGTLSAALVLLLGALSASPAGAQAPVRTRSLELFPGMNVISVPLVLPTTHGGPFDAADLTRLTSATFVARTLARSEAGSPPQTAAGTVLGAVFEAWVPGLGRRPFALEPGVGYVIQVRRPRTLTLRGTAWPRSVLTRRLPRGFGSVALPRGVPASETGASLLRRLGAPFLMRTRPGSDGRARLDLMLPGPAGGPFGLDDWRGYLTHLPGARDL
ncbi:MAG: hypothetical protein HY814_10125, partial [Candidatus Riflebacteria bacterium]|nr:hypothetical protein [Candidatus Riflebacteria bacterium]